MCGYVWVQSRRGWGSGGGLDFLGPPLQNFLIHFLKIFNTSSESSAHKLTIGTFFEEIWEKVCGGVRRCPQVKRHARESGPQGEASQRNSKALQTSRVVPA